MARFARIAAALICAIGTFGLAGCVLEKFNTEMKRQIDAEADRAIYGDDMTTDQRLVAQAVAALNGGAYYEAEALLDSAVQINPSNAVARLNLGAVYEATGRIEHAIQIYAQLAEPPAHAVSAASGVRDADVARIAASRLATLQAGKATPNLRKAVLQLSMAAADGRESPPPAHGASAAASAKVAAVKSEAGSAAQPAAAKPSGGAKEIRVTLATFPTEAAAKDGWQALAAKHATVLGDRAPLISKIDSGDGKGAAYRLATGPFPSARDAAAFCDRLLARRVYCLISG